MIRDAVAADAAALADIFLAARLAIRDIVPFVHPPESVAGFFVPEILLRRHRTVIGDADGRPAGFCAIAPGWIGHLYVHPRAHGQGLGSVLLAHAKASPEAAHGLQLWTFQANAGARRFYERHGFAAVQFTDGAGNDERTPDVRYAYEPGAASSASASRIDSSR